MTFSPGSKEYNLVHGEWDVSEHYRGDAHCNRLENLTDLKCAGFFPEKEFCYGTEGIKVTLLNMTDLKQFKFPLAYMTHATVGGSPPSSIIEQSAKEMYKGGLQHSLERIELIFEISGVSRALTHQIVRHRQWGFHQQSFRWSYLRSENIGFRLAPYVKYSKHRIYIENHLKESKQIYQDMVEENIPFQDCRDILPISTQTYIIAECSLKEFMNTTRYRACSFFQQQMVYVIKQMQARVTELYPWLGDHFKTSCEMTGKVMYQGWESADASAVCGCGAKGRDFKSEVYK
jgi:thymidylate synthase (FAD)